MGEAAWWLLIAAVFVVVELGHRAFYAMFIGLGALFAAMVAIAGLGVVVQIPVFVAAAIAGLVLIRPTVARAMSRGEQLVSGAEGLVGKEAVVVEAVGRVTHPGKIRIQGESWKAVSNNDETIAPGTVVMILDLQGSTFVVQDMPALGLSPFELPEDTT
ncbi:MAG: NfeD family protein [Acidimicrobiales bacterium]|jgi:membrane protein implicated in regulation of membrane protease activity